MSDLWWGDYLQQPLALAKRRWAEGTIIGWTGTLRDLGQFAAHWPDIEPHEALSRYLVQRAAMGQQPSTLRGVISAVRMAENPRRIPPYCTTRALAHGQGGRGGIGGTEAHPGVGTAHHVTVHGQGDPHQLVLARTQVRSALFFCVSVRPPAAGRGTWYPVYRLILRRQQSGRLAHHQARGVEWRAAMAAHPWVKRCPAHVPIVGASYTLQDALWALLAGSGWERGLACLETGRGGSPPCIRGGPVLHCSSW